MLGIEGCEVVEENLLPGDVGMLEVDRFDLDESEVTLPFLRRPDLAGNSVAGVEGEGADLRRRYVDVIGTGQVVVLGSAKKAETIRQAFEDAFREDQP